MAKKSTIPFDASELLREHGFKITPLRLLILAILEGAKKPLPVSTLVKKAKKLHADTASIYRALRAFTQADIVKELRLSKENATYEFMQGHRHHIVCDRCGLIESIPFCIRDFEAKAIKTSKMFRQVTSHSVDFFGTCRKCVRAVR